MSNVSNGSHFVELFSTIDNLYSSYLENDSIVAEVSTQLCTLVFKRTYLEEKVTNHKSVFKLYKNYLYKLQALISDQLEELEQLSNSTDYEDFSDTVFNFKEQFDELFLEQAITEYSYISAILTPKERDVYKKVRIYHYLDKYFKGIEKVETTEISNKDMHNSSNNDWKKYYYLIVSMENQKDFTQIIFSDYVSRRKNIDEISFLQNKSMFCAADFQGQISKSIFYQRKRLNLTQEELSKISGVDRSMIAKIETVKQPPTLETAIKLLSALNMGIAICPLGGQGEKFLLQLDFQK